MIAFILPFDIGIIGLHALMGFVFVGLIGLHVFNNNRQLASYLCSKNLWSTLATIAGLGNEDGSARGAVSNIFSRLNFKEIKLSLPAIHARWL